MIKNSIIALLSTALVASLVMSFILLDGWVRNSYNEGYVKKLKKGSAVLGKLIAKDLTKKQVLDEISPMEYDVYQQVKDWDGVIHSESIRIKNSGMTIYFSQSGTLVKIDSMFLNNSPIYSIKY